MSWWSLGRTSSMRPARASALMASTSYSGWKIWAPSLAPWACTAFARAAKLEIWASEKSLGVGEKLATGLTSPRTM